MASRAMAKAERAEGEELVQLATRIPKQLHFDVRLHCLKQQRTVMEFVVEALERNLKAQPKK